MASRQTTSRSKAREPDAIAVLIEDHCRAQTLFDRYKNSDDDAEKEEISEQVCTLLTIHTTIEEEIFYPAARKALEDDDLVDEAEVEHDVARGLIEQLQDGDLEPDKRDATMEVLSEYVGHHVEEEESELFKQVKKTELDLEEIGEELRERKAELEAELGVGDDDDAADDDEDESKAGGDEDGEEGEDAADEDDEESEADKPKRRKLRNSHSR